MKNTHGKGNNLFCFSSCHQKQGKKCPSMAEEELKWKPTRCSLLVGLCNQKRCQEPSQKDMGQRWDYLLVSNIPYPPSTTRVHFLVIGNTLQVGSSQPNYSTGCFWLSDNVSFSHFTKETRIVCNNWWRQLFLRWTPNCFSWLPEVVILKSGMYPRDLQADGLFLVSWLKMDVVKISGQHEAFTWEDTLVSSHVNMMGIRNWVSGESIIVLYSSLYRLPELTVDRILFWLWYLPKGFYGLLSRFCKEPKSDLSWKRLKSCFLKSKRATSTYSGFVLVSRIACTVKGALVLRVGIHFSIWCRYPCLVFVISLKMYLTLGFQ